MQGEPARLVARRWGSPRGNDELYYDGPDVALERRAPTGLGVQWVRYVHGPGADQPLAMETYPLNAAPTPGTGSQFYYHADGEGSVRLLTDANGQIANRYDYDSFGRRLAVTESVSQPYGWKGRDFIPGPYIYYNRARFYDPVLGRFMSQDPLGYGAGDFNLYSFAWNNPKKWNDPSGMVAASGYANDAEESTKQAPAYTTLGQRIACIMGATASVFEVIEAAQAKGSALREIKVDRANCGAQGLHEVTKVTKKRIKNAVCKKVDRAGSDEKADLIQDLIFDVISEYITDKFVTEAVFKKAEGRTYRADFHLGQEALESKGGFRVRFASGQRNAAFRQAVAEGADLFFLRILCKDQ